MKITQLFVWKKDCKHSVVFEPAARPDAARKEQPDICSSIYVSKDVLPAGCQHIGLTLDTEVTAS